MLPNLQLIGVRCTSARIGHYHMMLRRPATVALSTEAPSFAQFSISSLGSYVLAFLISSSTALIGIKWTRRVGFIVLDQCSSLEPVLVSLWVYLSFFFWYHSH